MTTPTPTATGAWIASGVALSTLPVCIYPLTSTIRQITITKPSSKSAGPHQLLTQAAVWVAMTLSHVCLTMHALLAATELGCAHNRIHKVFDYGWDSLQPNCTRNLLLFTSTLAEPLLAPVYPMSILWTYLKLLPRSRRKRLRSAIKGLVLVQSVLSAALCCITVIDHAQVWASDPFILQLSDQTTEIHRVTFSVWFAHMLACGCVGLVLSTRLLPHLKVRELSSSMLSARSARQDKSTNASSGTPGAKNSWVSSSFLHKRTSTASSMSKPAAQQMQVLVRWLRVCMASILVILVVNVGIVVLDLDPPVLFTIVGWSSCHCISFALYMATWLVKRAVIARRMIPQSMAGTLAKSGWSGAEEEVAQTGIET